MFDAQNRKKRVKKVGLHYHVPVILDPQSFIDTRNSILHLNKSDETLRIFHDIISGQYSFALTCNNLYYMNLKKIIQPGKFFLEYQNITIAVRGIYNVHTTCVSMETMTRSYIKFNVHHVQTKVFILRQSLSISVEQPIQLQLARSRF